MNRIDLRERLLPSFGPLAEVRSASSGLDDPSRPSLRSLIASERPMRRALGICLGLLGVFAPAISGQVSRIGVDRRVELMAIIFKLAGNREFNQNNFRTYNADIERHFGPFRDHEAVAAARALREQYGVGFSRVMDIALSVSDPPELRARVPLDSAAGWPAPAAP